MKYEVLDMNHAHNTLLKRPDLSGFMSVTDIKIPRGTVLLAIKRFTGYGGYGYDAPGIMGYYSQKLFEHKVGEWSAKIGRLWLCQSGWHVTDAANVNDHRGERIFIVECRGKIRFGGNKAVVSQVRLLKRIDEERRPDENSAADFCHRMLNEYVAAVQAAADAVAARG